MHVDARINDPGASTIMGINGAILRRRFTELKKIFDLAVCKRAVSKVENARRYRRAIMIRKG